jgi:hypothetical protein
MLSQTPLYDPKKKKQGGVGAPLWEVHVYYTLYKRCYRDELFPPTLLVKTYWTAQ